MWSFCQVKIQPCITFQFRITKHISNIKAKISHTIHHIYTFPNKARGRKVTDCWHKVYRKDCKKIFTSCSGKIIHNNKLPPFFFASTAMNLHHSTEKPLDILCLMCSYRSNICGKNSYKMKKEKIEIWWIASVIYSDIQYSSSSLCS